MLIVTRFDIFRLSFTMQTQMRFAGAESTMAWEERWHPLREEWVIVAAHRQDRPWNGETVRHKNRPRPPYVEDCYLCPGNARVSGAVNPQYAGIFAFDNDHPCVGAEAPTPPAIVPAPYRNQ